jgi:UDP-N-acetylglucosamine 3-dehydrogenase
MSEQPRLRAGLIGLGAMGRNHARVLSNLDGVQLVGVMDPAGDPSGMVRAPIVSTLAELLALGLDYAVVACPTGLHEEIGLELAAHGVGALIEKPLAPSVAAAERLVEAFESRALPAGVGHIERYNPALQSLRTKLEAGELGEVFQVVTRRQGPFPHRIADVGVVMDLATHDIDLTGWVTGQEYTSVSARTVSRSGRPHEDMVAVVAQLADGTMVNHLVNWLSPLKERSTVVTGERGCFVADTLTADLTFYANGAIDNEWDALRNFRGVAEGDMIRYAIRKREPLLVEHERFRDAVEGKDSDIVTLRQGLRTVEVAGLVLESARHGTTVPLANPRSE